MLREELLERIDNEIEMVKQVTGNSAFKNVSKDWVRGTINGLELAKVIIEEEVS